MCSSCHHNLFRPKDPDQWNVAPTVWEQWTRWVEGGTPCRKRKDEHASKDGFTHDQWNGGGKVFLTQQTRRLCDKQENEEDYSSGVQKDLQHVPRRTWKPLRELLAAYVRSLYQFAVVTREGHIGSDLPVSPGRLDRRGLEIVGRTLRSRTSCPLYIYCKFCANLFNIYLLFSLFFIRLCRCKSWWVS